MEDIRRALVLGLVLIAGTAFVQAPPVCPHETWSYLDSHALIVTDLSYIDNYIPHIPIQIILELRYCFL